MVKEMDLSLLFEVFVVAQRTKQLLSEVMARSPLTPEEYAVYSAIHSYSPLSTSELARRLGIPVTTMYDHVREIRDRGHVKRREDPRDRRAQLLALSAEGRAAHEEARVAFDRAIDPLLHSLRLPVVEVHGALAALGEACEAAIEVVRVGEFTT